MTHDECQHRADEAKALAVQTQDLLGARDLSEDRHTVAATRGTQGNKVAKPAS
jgi:hypothetical protein